MTESLEQKLRDRPRFANDIRVCQPMINEFEVWFKDFVELYQKTRQTLHQQIKELPSRLDSSVKVEGLLTADLVNWVKRSDVLGLLDRPNEDYIVIKRKQLRRQLFNPLTARICQCMDIEENESMNAVDMSKPADCGLSDVLEWVQKKEEELLGLPNKKKETTK